MASDPTQPGGRQPGLIGDEEDADIPPPPLGGAADPLDEDAQARLQRMSRRGRLLPTLLVIVALGAFVAIVWWAYRTANVPDTTAEVPVVEAEPGDEKVRPDSEGGLDVPNQDVLIYEGLGQGEGQQDVERLMPPPEEPLEPPAPPPPAVEAAPPETAGLTPPPAPQEVAPMAPDGAEADATEAETTVPDSVPAEAAPPVAEAPAEPAASDSPAAESAPAPDPAPAPVPQVAGAGDGFRIQLAAVKSEADARAEWTRLQKAHSDLLGGLQPTIERADLGAQGIFYRIQGGSLPSREAAAALCDQLKAKNQACLVVKP